jgi:hypothetical protein
MPRRPKKGKSPSLQIRNLIKDLNHVELALLRERVLHICELTLQDLKLNPHKWNRGFIAPALVESTMDKCIKSLSSEEEVKTKKNKISITTETVIVESEEVIEIEAEVI